MRLSLLGVNHRTAPVEIRERFAIPESRLAEATQRLAKHPGVEEGIIFSTCNRVELLVSSENGHTDCAAFCRSTSRLTLRLTPNIFTNWTSAMQSDTCSVWLRVWIQ